MFVAARRVQLLECGFSIAICCLVSLTTHGQQVAKPLQISKPTQIRFDDLAVTSGLQFRHEDGSCGKRYLVELVGAGLATFDADNDGWIDAFMLNGAALPGAKLESKPSNQFYRNLQSGNFAQATTAARCGDEGYSLGVTVGDFNNDGFNDLFVTNYGQDQLLQNNGDGTFSDVTRQTGVDDQKAFGAGAAFLDIDQDGDLDLFSANYVKFSYERHEMLAPTAYPFSPGPRDFPPETDSIFVNNGDGTFTDDSDRSGMTSVAGPSMGVVAGDFDYDGDSDIFVCCDGAPNLFYRNDGQGNFVEDALLVGVAYDLRGVANGSMGVDVGDLDGDQLDDLVVTDYADQLMMLFRCLGPGGVFEDSARISQIGSEVLPHVKWGLGLVDLDCDGDRDAVICNGHLLENAKEIDPRTAYGVANSVMENDGKGLFRSITAETGEALKHVASSRGSAFDDLDNDGDIDGIILNCDAEAQYLVNQYFTGSRGGKSLLGKTPAIEKPANRWIELELRGRSTNRSAVGSRVTVHAGKSPQVAEVRSGRGYQSHYGSRLHFGLAEHATIDRIEITWHGGGTQVLTQVPADQILVIVQE